MAADLYQVQMTWEANGFPVTTSWYFEDLVFNNPDPVPTCHALNGQINFWLGPQLVNVIPRNFRGARFATRRMNNSGGPTVIERFLLNGSPGSGWASRPAYCPYIAMSYITGGQYRWHHFTIPAVWDGWFTYPRVTEEQLVELRALTSFLANFPTVTGGQWNLRVWERKTLSPQPIRLIYTKSTFVRTVKKRLRSAWATRHS